MELNQFIKGIKLDEQDRIIVSIHEFLESYLASPENRKMLKDGLVQMLGGDFKQLEIAKNICRVTVTEGTEQANLVKLETELKAAIELALSFMTNPPHNPNLKN
jgi:hypothetical protein